MPCEVHGPSAMRMELPGHICSDLFLKAIWTLGPCYTPAVSKRPLPSSWHDRARPRAILIIELRLRGNYNMPKSRGSGATASRIMHPCFGEMVAELKGPRRKRGTLARRDHTIPMKAITIGSEQGCGREIRELHKHRCPGD